MSRKKIIAGNWKMQKTAPEAELLLAAVSKGTQEVNCEIWIAPPFIYLQKFIPAYSTFSIQFGAQNCSDKTDGAYTGEISAGMLKSIGTDFVIVGHSERRQYFDETDEIIYEKILRVTEQNMTAVLCCGETLEQRNASGHFGTVQQQLEASLYLLQEKDLDKLILAYEPVWAIGTGVNASAEEAGEMHAHIREIVQSQFGKAAAEKIRILYGGSVKPGNAAELFSMSDIDGGLIGGASLNAADFLQIAECC